MVDERLLVVVPAVDAELRAIHGGLLLVVDTAHGGLIHAQHFTCCDGNLGLFGKI